MGRFSPTVQPTSASPLTAAIAGLGQGLEQGRERRYADEDHKENSRLRRLQEIAQRAGLARLGVFADTDVPGTPSAPPPVAASLAGSPDYQAGTVPAQTPSIARPSAPPPVSSSLAGSPDYQTGSGDMGDDVFAQIAATGRPKAAPPTPAPGAWHPNTGFYGIPTSRFSAAAQPPTPPAPPVRIGDGYSYHPDQSPEALAATREEQSYERRRAFETDLSTQQRETANRRSFDALVAAHAGNPLAQSAYNPAIDYTAETPNVRTEEQQSAKERRDGEAAYNLIKQIAPNHPLVQKPFDPTAPTKYAAAVSIVGQQQAHDETRTDNGRAAYDALRADFPDHPFAKEPFDAADPGKYALAYGKAKTTQGKVASIAPLALANFARFKAAVPTMDAQHQIMTAFEQQVERDPNLFNGVDQFQAAFYKQSPTFSATHAVESALTQSHLDKSNPQLARYLRAAARWALEDGSIQQRGGSESRVALDQFVSAIGPNMDAASIQDTQEGRITRLNGFKEVMPAVEAMLSRTAANPAAGANVAPAPTRLAVASQAEYNHLVSPAPNGAGMTDAQVAARYDIPASIKRRGAKP